MPKKKPTTSEFITRSQLIHGTKYDYSKTVYVTAKDQIIIICPVHGEFLQTPDNHLHKHGCNMCANNKTYTMDQFVSKSRLIHKNKYDYSRVNYINNRKNVEIVCPSHGSFNQRPAHHMSGVGCRKCTNNISKKELLFLDTLEIDETNRQVRIENFTVDGFEPQTKTIYEFLGDYWHGNPKMFKREHYNSLAHKTFGELYDFCFEYKFKMLKNCGYTVKYLWECDWDNKTHELVSY